MVLIFGLAAAAYMAVTSYNSLKAVNPVVADGVVRHVRQSTGVLLALGNAVRNVIDALLLISRPAQQAVQHQVIPGQATRIGVAAGS